MNLTNNLRFPIGSSFKILPLAVGLALTSFTNGSFSQQVVVVAPAPVVQVVVPVPSITLFGGDYDSRRDTRNYGRRGRESRQVAHAVGGREGKR